MLGSTEPWNNRYCCESGSRSVSGGVDSVSDGSGGGVSPPARRSCNNQDGVAAAYRGSVLRWQRREHGAWFGDSVSDGCDGGGCMSGPAKDEVATIKTVLRRRIAGGCCGESGGGSCSCSDGDVGMRHCSEATLAAVVAVALRRGRQDEVVIMKRVLWRRRR